MLLKECQWSVRLGFGWRWRDMGKRCLVQCFGIPQQQRALGHRQPLAALTELFSELFPSVFVNEICNFAVMRPRVRAGGGHEPRVHIAM